MELVSVHFLRTPKPDLHKKESHLEAHRSKDLLERTASPVFISLLGLFAICHPQP